MHAVAPSTILEGQAAGERFGAAIAMHLDLLVIGAPGAGGGIGAVRVYRFGGSAWVLEATLVAPDGRPGDGFGESIAVLGDRVAVGLPGRDDYGPDTGAVDLFRHAAGGWAHERRFECIDSLDAYGDSCATGPGGDRFGEIVALADPHLIVAEPGRAIEQGLYSPGSLSQFRFRNPRYAGVLGRMGYPTGARYTGEVEFPSTLATDGDTLLIGLPGYANDSGTLLSSTITLSGIAEADTFHPYQSGSWQGARLGEVVAVWKDVVALWRAWASASNDDNVQIIDPRTGSYPYYSITCPDPSDPDDFGRMLALGPDVLLAGRPRPPGCCSVPPCTCVGRAWVFRRGVDTWSLEAELDNPGLGNGDAYAETGAVWGEVFAVGAPLDDTAGVDAGRVLVFGEPTTCGDGIVDPGEECDNGPDVPADGCSRFCQDEVACNDDVDNDSDGLVDFLDPACPRASPDYDSEKSSQLVCDDGIDNDGDGLVDIDVVSGQGDPACRYAGNVTETAACEDGIDNDGDGLLDHDGAGDPLLADPECVGRPWSHDESAVKLYGAAGIPGVMEGWTWGLGWSLAASGNRFIASAGGGVLVYERNGNGFDVARIEHDEVLVQFGPVVAISGDVALISGGRRDPVDPTWSFGRVFVYRYDGAGWRFEQELSAYDEEPQEYFDAGQAFGAALAVEGDLAVVGAPDDDAWSTASGAFYTFRYDGATWQFEEKHVSPAAMGYDYFGSVLDLRDGRLVVGVPRSDYLSTEAGMAIVYRDGAPGLAIEQILFPGPDLVGWFGAAVAAVGDLLAVGAPLADGPGTNDGAVQIYRSDGTRFVEEQRIVALEGGSSMQFGTDVVIADGRIAVLNPRVGVSFFDRIRGRWYQTREIRRSTGPSPYSGWHRNLAFFGSELLLGSPQDDDFGANRGAIHVLSDLGYTIPIVPGLGPAVALSLAVLLGASGHRVLKRRGG